MRLAISDIKADSKRILTLAICCILIFNLIFLPSVVYDAKAEALTVTVLGAGLVAVAAALGMSYIFDSFTPAQTQSYAEQKVTQGLGGSSPADVFGISEVSYEGLALYFPKIIYDWLVDQVDGDILEFDIQPGQPKVISPAALGGIPITEENYTTHSTLTPTEFESVPLAFGNATVNISTHVVSNKTRWAYTITIGGQTITNNTLHRPEFYQNYQQYPSSNKGLCCFIQSNTANIYLPDSYQGTEYVMNRFQFSLSSMGPQTGSVSGSVSSTYNPPALSDTQLYKVQSPAWSTASDLSEATSDIFDVLSEGALESTGEVVEGIEPGPTPVPTAGPQEPDTLLPDTTQEGLLNILQNFGSWINNTVLIPIAQKLSMIHLAVNSISTAIGNLAENIYSKFTNVLEGIRTGVGNIVTTLTSLPENIYSKFTTVLEGIRTGVGNVVDRINAGVTTLVNSISTVIEGIHTAAADIVDAIEAVLEGVLEAIEEGPIRIFRLGLQGIIEVFRDLLDRLSSLLGIWHYVVEWFYSISSPFSYFFGIAQNVSYNLILPVYACIAGGIVLAVYKRFGR